MNAPKPLILCPRCRTAYRPPREALAPDVLFLCKRCGARFDRTGRLAADSAGREPSSPHASLPETPSLFDRPAAPPPERQPAARSQPRAQAAAPPAAPKARPAIPPAPPRRSLAPWIGAALIGVAIVGAFVERTAWLAEPHVRRALAALGWPSPRLAGDWRIPPQAVHIQRLVRPDGVEMLLIEGRIENRGPRPAAPPRIRVRLLGEAGTRWTRTMPITEPPSLDAILRAPWTPPPIDRTPIAPGDGRGFLLVIERPPIEAERLHLRPIEAQAD